MGQETENRTEIFAFRLAPSEAAAIQEKAAAELRPPAQWARIQILRAAGVLPQQTMEVPR